MATRFRALKDFYSEEARSAYAAGLSYTVRDGNAALAALVAGWLKDGRVELVEAPALPIAKVSGKGKVG